MKVLFQLLFVVVFVAVLSVEADKAKVEDESVDVLDQAFYGIETSDNAEESDSDSGEEEDTTTTTGPVRGRGRGSHGRGRGGRINHRVKAWRKTMTPDEKFEFVCRAIKSKSSSFRQRKMAIKLRNVDPEVKQKFESALAARTTAMSECCLLGNGTEGIQCAQNIRTERYTRVCNGEEPLCIWSLLKGKGTSTHQSETVTKCCKLQGEERSTCFMAAKPKHFGKFNGRNRKTRD